MKVNVSVRESVVIMLVYVNVCVLPQRSPQRADAQDNNHDCDAELEPAAHCFRDRYSQTQHDRRHNE